MTTAEPTMTHLVLHLRPDASEAGISQFTKSHSLAADVLMPDAPY